MSTGRLAVVTGASSGIGRSIAIRLAQAGWRIAFSYVGDVGDANETAAHVHSLGGTAMFQRCDVGVKEDVEAFFAAVIGEHGAPDLLVNNAGIQTWGALLDLSFDDWDRVIRTNLTGCFLNTQAAARAMRDAGRRGTIINIGSGSNKLGFPGLVSYTASKGGIDQFTKVAAGELGPLGITVNCVAPGAIMVERTAKEGGDFEGNWSRITPLRRVGQPDDVAEAVLWLASPAAAFVSGQTLYVDGGVFSQARWPIPADA